MLKCILHTISLLLALALFVRQSHLGSPGGLELSIRVAGLEPTI